MLRFSRHSQIGLCLKIAVAIATALTVVSPMAEASRASCRAVFTPEAEKPLPDDLQGFYRNEIRKLNKKAISKLNDQLLQTWKSYHPTGREGRAKSVSVADLRALIELARKSEVVGSGGKANYARAETEIGYCFGRAAYLHTMLLKMGLQEQSMRKVWIVGPTKVAGESFNWDYHVALMVYSTEQGWVTLDTSEFKPLPMRYWMQENMRRSTDGRARFYVTSASKFNIQFGKYSRVQMGLDLSKGDDWFRGYFKDMLADVRGTDLEASGLKPIAREAMSEDPAAVPPPERQVVTPVTPGFFNFLFD